MSQHKQPSNAYTLTFVVILCFSCSLILSVLASALRAPQEEAELLERSKQMLRSARIFHPSGYFLIRTDAGEFVPARYEGGILVQGSEEDYASSDEILDIFSKRIQGFLVDTQGNEKSFEEMGINEAEYVEKHWKAGFAKLPLKVAYRVLPNIETPSEGNPVGYIFPVSGFGLWDAIAGYLSIEPDGTYVRGIAWYWHKETPGLGAEISEARWQKLFPGKSIFQQNPDGSFDRKTSPIGITVVRGMVQDVYGDGPRAKSAVDGMAGATLTGVGVTKAYKDTLEAYRPYLIQLNEKYEQSSNA